MSNLFSLLYVTMRSLFLDSNVSMSTRLLTFMESELVLWMVVKLEGLEMHGFVLRYSLLVRYPFLIDFHGKYRLIL